MKEKFDKSRVIIVNYVNCCKVFYKMQNNDKLYIGDYAKKAGKQMMYQDAAIKLQSACN